ncbi:hypothetical protein ACFSX9_10820 [Flavobacterium ardleyense]|uniref:DUF7668 domain-containing protein n=1 Tax=Flavobacterium ardleyense TaxID=2038737 RepID=A0ABW5ZAH4_9FLAO
MGHKLKDYEDIIAELVYNIANNKYNIIKEKGQNGRVNIDDLIDVIQQYDCTIVPLPEEAFSLAEVFQVKDEDILDVYLPLWTKEEGRSDLTISLSCLTKNGEKTIIIEDLGVL